MKTITLEEHFVTTEFLKATDALGGNTPIEIARMQEKLLDLGDIRLRAMDEGGVTQQVLSLAAHGLDKLTRENANVVLGSVHDEAAAAVRAHPDRFAAFATPGLRNVPEAIKEIERAITQLGFKGVMIDGTIDNKFLDAPEFFPLLEAIQALNVPLYIHPAPPPAAVNDIYYGNLPDNTGFLLSIAGWGWHSETAIHILRLIVSGVLDRLPQLQIIIGHMGEMLPFALARSNAVFSQAKHLKRSVAETFAQQVHITTSGYFTRPPFECARTVLGLDRMMYSVDYPFSPTTRGKEFLAALGLNDTDLAALTHRNAERLLKL
ncbi:MAG TPA: amidohydrolase family protein [Acidobacteriaceae bacterium]